MLPSRYLADRKTNAARGGSSSRRLPVRYPHVQAGGAKAWPRRAIRRRLRSRSVAFPRSFSLARIRTALPNVIPSDSGSSEGAAWTRKSKRSVSRSGRCVADGAPEYKFFSFAKCVKPLREFQKYRFLLLPTAHLESKLICLIHSISLRPIGTAFACLLEHSATRVVGGVEEMAAASFNSNLRK